MSTPKIQLPLWKKALKDAFPKFQLIDKDRALTELGFAMQLIESNPTLQQCSPESIVNSILNIARTSVTLNPVLKLAYLIPRKGQCCLEFSYTGLIGLLCESGVIKHISAYVAYEDEDFAFNPVSMSVLHKPTNPRTEKEQNERLVSGAYSRAVLPDGTIVFEYMPFWELEKIRLKSQIKREDSIWNEWTFEMYKKSVIRRHYKTLLGLSGIKNQKLQNILDVEYANIVSDSDDPNANKTNFENIKNELTDLLALPESTIEYIKPEFSSKKKNSMNFEEAPKANVQESIENKIEEPVTIEVKAEVIKETPIEKTKVAQKPIESKTEATETTPNFAGMSSKNRVEDLGEAFGKTFEPKEPTKEQTNEEGAGDAFAFDLNFELDA